MTKLNIGTEVAQVGDTANSSSTQQPTRQDTVAIKQELADGLGEHASVYWQALKDFLGGKYTRAQFDAKVSSIMDKRLVSLHNKFIFAIFHNVQRAVPLPTGPQSTDFTPRADSAKRKAEDLTPAELRKRARTEHILNLEMVERNRLRILRQKQEETITTSPAASTVPIPPVVYKHVPELSSETIDMESLPVSCKELKDLPTREQVKSQMKFYCAMNGVPDGLDEGGVDLVFQALQNYLKIMMETNLQKCRPKFLEGFEPSPSKSESLDNSIDDVYMSRILANPVSALYSTPSSSSSSSTDAARIQLGPPASSSSQPPSYQPPPSPQRSPLYTNLSTKSVPQQIPNHASSPPPQNRSTPYPIASPATSPVHLQAPNGKHNLPNGHGGPEHQHRLNGVPRTNGDPFEMSSTSHKTNTGMGPPLSKPSNRPPTASSTRTPSNPAVSPPPLAPPPPPPPAPPLRTSSSGKQPSQPQDVTSGSAASKRVTPMRQKGRYIGLEELDFGFEVSPHLITRSIGGLRLREQITASLEDNG
ncbi:transcriptional regulator of RNA polII, SAGA, subunit-domain-containing protein [Cladochytrium replicatum]|nr:transcriptional regulator of RNA polII, SAGA, subunit-domain-containing protein [Cladochytrium replicatum]